MKKIISSVTEDVLKTNILRLVGLLVSSIDALAELD